MKTLFTSLIILTFFNVFSSDKNQILTINPVGHKGTIRTLLVDNDKNIITAGYDKVIKIWNSETGYLEREIYGQIGPGSEGMIYAMGLSPNNKYLAVSGWMGNNSGTEAVGDIRLYNYKTGKMEKLLQSHYQPVHGLAFASNRYLYSYDGEGNVYLWDVENSDVWQFSQIGPDVTAIAVMGDFLVVTHRNGIVDLWSTSNSEKPVKTYKK